MARLRNLGVLKVRVKAARPKTESRETSSSIVLLSTSSPSLDTAKTTQSFPQSFHYHGHCCARNFFPPLLTRPRPDSLTAPRPLCQVWTHHTKRPHNVPSTSRFAPCMDGRFRRSPSRGTRKPSSSCRKWWRLEGPLTLWSGGLPALPMHSTPVQSVFAAGAASGRDLAAGAPR